MGGGLRKSSYGLKTNVEQSAQPEVEQLRAQLVGFWEQIAEMERRGYTGPAIRTLKSNAVKLSALIEEHASRHRTARTKDAR
jgi:hypothetical protein